MERNSSTRNLGAVLMIVLNFCCPKCSIEYSGVLINQELDCIDATCLNCKASLTIFKDGTVKRNLEIDCYICKNKTTKHYFTLGRKIVCKECQEMHT
jgi:hypothetical protein